MPKRIITLEASGRNLAEIDFIDLNLLVRKVYITENIEHTEIFVEEPYDEDDNNDDSLADIIENPDDFEVFVDGDNNVYDPYL